MPITDTLMTRPLILVVDDMGSVRSVLARALLDAGYHVLTASEASGALRLLDRLPARPDLAVIDLYMPHGPGEALAAELSRRHPGLPLIFLSAFGHHPDAVLPGLLFEKPVRLGALCRTIAHMLGLAAGGHAQLLGAAPPDPTLGGRHHDQETLGMKEEPEDGAQPRMPAAERRVIGRARVTSSNRLLGLPRDRWLRIVARNPDALHPEALKGYVWIDVAGRLRHVWAAYLEIEYDPAHAGQIGSTGITYAIETCGGRSVLRVRMADDVRAEPLAHHLLHLAAQQLFACPQLIDVRAGRFALSRDDVTWIVGLVAGLRHVHGLSRVGMVVGDEASYVAAQLYGTLARRSDPGFAVFRELTAAEWWVCQAGPDPGSSPEV
jgi:CheY-like chemotaxis protein